MKMKQIVDCPKCKSKQGWFTTRTVKIFEGFSPDGRKQCIQEMQSKGGKQKRCLECKTLINNCIMEGE